MTESPKIRKGQIWVRKRPYFERYNYVLILNSAFFHISYKIVAYTTNMPSFEYFKMNDTYQANYDGFIQRYELTPFKLSDLEGMRYLIPNFFLEKHL